MQSGNKNLSGVSFTLVCVFLLLSTSIVSLGFLKISFAQTSPPPGQPVIQNRTIDLRSFPQLTIIKPQPLPVNPVIPPNPIPSSMGTQRGCKDLSIGINGENRVNIGIVLPGVPAWVGVNDNYNVIAEGTVRESRISSSDYPLLHDSHDQNFLVALDPKYKGLNSDANPIAPSGERLMEMEWESKYFPFNFWPAAGDRVWMEGRWIFDCGHPPYRTEIHPPSAVAFTRFNPIIFPGDSSPSDAVKTFIYIHGRGGHYNTPVGGKNYAFNITLPPKPSPDARLRMLHLNLPFGGPAPVLAPIPRSNPTKVHVVYPLASVAPSPDKKFAAIFAVGWDEPRNTQAYRQLRVIVDSVRVLNDKDPLASGEYRLWTNVNGNWIPLSGIGLNDVDNGETVRGFNMLFPDVIVKETDGKVTIGSSGWESDAVDAYFGCKTDFRARCLSIPLALDNNDGICGGNAVHSLSDNFGIGRHVTPIFATCRDFTLSYNIVEVRKFHP